MATATDEKSTETTNAATADAGAKAPATKAPATKAPATKAPATKAPATKAPATKAPATKAPATKAPATKAPATKKTTTKKTTTKKKAPPLKVVKVGEISEVPILSIHQYDNPRREPASLYDIGYVLIGDPKNTTFDADEDGEWILTVGDKSVVVDDAFDEANFVSLVHLATGDIDQARRYVELIDEHESVDRDETPHAPQSIVELAEDIYHFDQLYPVLGRKDSKGYTGIDGGRRIAARLYLHALSRVLIADKETHDLFGDKTPKEQPAVVVLTEQNCKPDEVRLLSIVANVSRKQFTELQEGRVYHDMLEEENPATKKKFTMKEAASYLNVPYGTFRNREALWRDPEFRVEDSNGNQVYPNSKGKSKSASREACDKYVDENPRKEVKVKRAKGLTDADREKVANGEMLMTAASRKSLGEVHYAERRSGKPAGGRAKAVPLSEMQRMFDETAENRKERRETIAECMGISLAQAIKESEERIAALEQKAA